MFGVVYQKHPVYGRVCEDLVGENHLRYFGKLPEQLFPCISALLVSDDNYFHTLQASMNKSYRKMKRREDYSKWINRDRKSTRLNSSHVAISYAVFCLKKKN